MVTAMTFDEFSASLRDETPPAGTPRPLFALWRDGKGDWTGAHEIAQDVDTVQGAIVHAYLHRKEGDLDNARYWYQRAGRPVPTSSLATEWKALVEEMLRSEP
jgi:hypothetical protein